MLEEEGDHLTPQGLQLEAARRVLQTIWFAMPARRF
jgi:hypothetical protein